MAYTINKTDGSIFATVNDGTINSASSVTIIGKNYAGYGAFLGENFIRLLESGANATAPTNKLEGQLWFDTSQGVLKVWDGTVFKKLGGTVSSATEPTVSVQTGDMWFDTANSQLNIYDGADFILIGPSFTGTTGTSGAVVDTIKDSISVDHVVVKLYVENDVVAMISKDATFAILLADQFTGFTGTLSPGIQLSSSLPGGVPTFIGQASDSVTFDGQALNTFLRSNVDDLTSGTLSIQNDGGVTVGVDDDLSMQIINDTHGRILNNNATGDILISVGGGTPVDVITVDGSTQRAKVAAPLTSTDIANRQYVLDNVSNMLKRDGTITITGVITPSSNGTINFGSTGLRYATIYATTFNGLASSAQYADLAERFHADADYAPGTIVELGGAEEITKAVDDLSDSILGVISTNAGFLMNAGAGESVTHPPVAMSGRVPVRVIGKVNRGDRLVSAGNGLARAATTEEITSFNVIGRSLISKTTDGEGTVEAIVTVN